MNISKSARGSHNVPFSPVRRRDGSEFDQPLPGAFRHLSLNRERELHNPFNTDGAQTVHLRYIISLGGGTKSIHRPWTLSWDELIQSSPPLSPKNLKKKKILPEVTRLFKFKFQWGRQGKKKTTLQSGPGQALDNNRHQRK